MKVDKKILIGTVLLILIVALLLMYEYANYVTKENYIKSFNDCKERIPKLDNELNGLFSSYPEAQKCIAAGGCFETCGSGCGLPEPTISFSEMFEFYLGGPKFCLAVCTTGCLYPI